MIYNETNLNICKIRAVGSVLDQVVTRSSSSPRSHHHHGLIQSLVEFLPARLSSSSLHDLEQSFRMSTFHVSRFVSFFFSLSLFPLIRPFRGFCLDFSTKVSFTGQGCYSVTPASNHPPWATGLLNSPNGGHKRSSEAINMYT